MHGGTSSIGTRSRSAWPASNAPAGAGDYRALHGRTGAGSYTLQLMASDAAGDSSPVSVTFRVP
jgi:hypothetical protein